MMNDRAIGHPLPRFAAKERGRAEEAEADAGHFA
jgi:hypothetical protein